MFSPPSPHSALGSQVRGSNVQLTITSLCLRLSGERIHLQLTNLRWEDPMYGTAHRHITLYRVWQKTGTVGTGRYRDLTNISNSLLFQIWTLAPSSSSTRCPWSGRDWLPHGTMVRTDDHGILDPHFFHADPPDPVYDFFNRSRYLTKFLVAVKAKQHFYKLQNFWVFKRKFIKSTLST